MPIIAKKYIDAQIQVAPGLRDWLYTVKSLTDKLYTQYGSADLTVLSQKWLSPNWWDQHMLGIYETKLLQREILMKSKQVPYWYARSIIPASCYMLNPDFFERLQHESIRNLIFDNEQVERVEMITYSVNQFCLEWYWVSKYVPAIDTPIWLRLIEYRFLSQQSFYVLELLLPELESIP